MLAGALAVYFAEHAAGGAEWSPPVRRRALVDQRARDHKTNRLLTKPRDHKLSTPALGIALDGDLPSWVQGCYVVSPAHLRGKAMGIVGAPGAGKTISALRLAYLAGLLGRKVRFADLLGSFAVLSLLYRAQLPEVAAGLDVDQDDTAAQAGEPASKRERVRQAYAALVAAGEPVIGTRLAQAAGVSASYGRALLAEFQTDPSAAQPNGQRPEPARAEP